MFENSNFRDKKTKESIALISVIKIDILTYIRGIGYPVVRKDETHHSFRKVHRTTITLSVIALAFNQKHTCERIVLVALDS